MIIRRRLSFENDRGACPVGRGKAFPAQVGKSMIKSYGISKTGLVRKVNEDSIWTGDRPFFILADGMGGYEGGQIASASAVEAARNYFEALPVSEYSEAAVREAILRANDAILKKKMESESLAHMGTTMVMAAIAGSTLYWGHVGDSRLYLMEDGHLRQVTTDHSFVMTLVEEGKITKEEMREHPRKNEITRAVGISHQLDVDTGTILLKGPLLILICSDGLSTMLADETIQAVILSYGHTEEELEACTKALVEKVYEAGATDNTSAILVHYEPATEN